MDNIETKKENTLPVVSYSKITTYKNCPKSYKFGYIDKLPRLDKPYTVFGSFCHSSLEAFHNHYLQGSDDPIDVVMKKSFSEAITKWKEKLTKEQIQEAFGIMQDYLNLIVDNMPNVLHVEKKIWMEIDNKFVFYGFIDRVQQDKDGIFHIVDYKTTKDEKYLKDRMQLLLYAYSLYTDNKEIDKIRTSYILLKQKNRSLVEEHKIEELIAAKDKLVDIWDMISLDKLFRATPMAWKCKNCDYINNCPDGQKMLKKPNFGKVDW